MIAGRWPLPPAPDASAVIHPHDGAHLTSTTPTIP